MINKNRIGLSFGHISNANIGEKNPVVTDETTPEVLAVARTDPVPVVPPKSTSATAPAPFELIPKFRKTSLPLPDGIAILSSYPKTIA